MQIIDTTETRVYYDSDHMVDGGPTFAGCPQVEYESTERQTLQLCIDNSGKWWQIVYNDLVLMESTNRRDVLRYFDDYMTKFENWLFEQRDG